MEKIKNILFVIQLPPPVHGASIMNELTKKSAMINSKYNCTYINLSPARDLQDIGKNSISKYFKILGIYKDVFTKLLINKIDVVYVTLSVTKIGFIKDSIIVLLGKLFRKKIIIHLHGKGIKNDYIKSTYLFKKYYEYVYSNTYVIHLSNCLTYDTEQFSTVKNRFVLPNAIENVNVTKFKKKKTDKLQFLYLSNMIETKGVLVLVEAITKLREYHNNFIVTFVGKFSNENFREIFEQKIAVHHLEEIVNYIGPLYGHDKYQVYKNSDIFLFPTYSKETFGIVNLEAMQFSLPVISTKVGAIPDIIEDNLTGFLVDEKDATALAQKMEIFILNPSLGEKMGAKGREKYLKKYTIERFENNLINILKDVIDEN